MVRVIHVFYFLLTGTGERHVQHSYPVLVARRGQGRRLPPTPCKPSTLQLKPTNINFPKLNASPTHVSELFDSDYSEVNVNYLSSLQQNLHSSHNTPHSVHSLPHSRDFLRDHREAYYREREREKERLRERERERDYGLRYEFRDRERELFERERERERDIERELERVGEYER